MFNLKTGVAVVFLWGAFGGVAAAQSLAVSVAVRETGSVADLFEDGGTNDGIEFVDRDLNVVALDGAWHYVSFDLAQATLTAFAGTTANGVYDTARGVLEHLRIRNISGETAPLRIWIDDLRFTDLTGAMPLDGWESAPLGSEHIFRAPAFSGSTFSNLIGPSSSAVTDATAHSGAHSYEMNFQFVDDDPTRWVRVQTWNALSGGNPTVDFGGTVSFWIKGQAVPTPGCGATVAGLLAVGAARRRRARGSC